MCDVDICKYPTKTCYYEHLVQSVKKDTFRFAKENKAKLDDLDRQCEKAKTKTIQIDKPND